MLFGGRLKLRVTMLIHKVPLLPLSLMSFPGATAGVYYNVAVQAVNVVGSSAISTSVTIVAAVAPQPPSTI